MMSLPRWADTPLGHELLAAIRRNPPESSLVRDDWGTRDCPRFTGKLAGRLRKMREEWVDREMALLDRQYHATHRWDEEASRTVLGTEEADALVRRVLAEAEQRRAAA